MRTLFLLLLFLSSIFNTVSGSDYSSLWLNYKKISDKSQASFYKSIFHSVYVHPNNFSAIIMEELSIASDKLLSCKPAFTSDMSKASVMMVYSSNALLGNEGYSVRYINNRVIIEANSDAGFLYATYHLIRLFQTGKLSPETNITEVPAFSIRQLNHWDDLDGNIERGYAGKSLWKWNELPDNVSSRYRDYARLNASLGINGVVINNVNADPRILRSDYLKKIKVLADIFRQYNIKLYLSINFASPLKPSSTPDVMKKWGGIGILETADPTKIEVKEWWEEKVAEIYNLIPDFGGFLVKANSEGMPGPHDYGQTHAQGANFLAGLLKPYGGLVIWRAFVYETKGSDKDRYKRAYNEFMPLDGQFDDNVILQIKNGPMDFQPSEPVSPLFGGMKATNIMPELQITQEYMGHSTYLVYLLPMWKKFFDFDTYSNGKGSTIANILTRHEKYPAIAGVANTGDNLNWTGHEFAQANWYAFGRLAWNPYTSTDVITNDWIEQTWGVSDKAHKVIYEMMMPTWESFVKASSPNGLGLTTNVYRHYEAAFWHRNNNEWKANSEGVGTDRTSTGTGYSKQYYTPNTEIFDDINKCPEELLLCFHFIRWDYKMPDGTPFKKYFMDGLKSGIRQAEKNISLWKSIENEIDETRFESVLQRLNKELKDAGTFYNEAVKFFTEVQK